MLDLLDPKLVDQGLVALDVFQSTCLVVRHDVDDRLVEMNCVVSAAKQSTLISHVTPTS